ncbi:MAG: response regulator [Chloroflexi bacterium]|nr:MAG: response regulator [Chloroflexota bacterium]
MGMQESQEQHQGGLILVVEDDPDIGALLTNIIVQETPYGYVLATDGVQALQIVEEMKPILFILDYRLPIMNGIELYDRLHAIKELEHVPAMMVSAYLPEREVQERKIVGMYKPFDLSKLLDAIEMLAV